MNDDIERTDEALVGLAWSLWGALGVSTWVAPARTTVIEVEPLIAYTAFVARDDRRLLREARSWVVEQMPLLSIRQFKNVVTTQRWPFEGPVKEFGAVLAAATRKPWPGAGEGRSDLVEGDRPAIADLTTPCALQLRLRSLLGVSARAEIVRILLLSDHPWTVSELSHRVPYTRRQVGGEIDHLTKAAIVQRAPSPGPAKVSLAHPQAMRELVGPVGHDLDWAPLFRLLTGLRELLGDMATQSWSQPSVELARQMRWLEPQRSRVHDDWETPAATTESVADAIVQLLAGIPGSGRDPGNAVL